MKYIIHKDLNVSLCATWKHLPMLGCGVCMSLEVVRVGHKPFSTHKFLFNKEEIKISLFYYPIGSYL